MVGAFNPLVLVKPAVARGPLATSDAPIELADVARSLCGGAGCSPAEGLRRLEAVDPGRTRAAFWYTWKHAYWRLPQIPGLVRYSIRGRPFEGRELVARGGGLHAGNGARVSPRGEHRGPTWGSAGGGGSRLEPGWWIRGRPCS